MTVFSSKLNTQSPTFAENRQAMLDLVERLRALESRAAAKSDERRPRFQERGQLTPRERLSQLLDPGMPFLLLYNMAGYLVDDRKPETSIPGASMITGIGFVSGVRCLVFVDDSGINAGASTRKSVDKALGCLGIALRQKLPFIHLVESAGANLMEYTVDLWAHGGGMFHGQARLSAAGIPVITVLHGPSTAGGAYQPGMSDYVIGVKKNGMAALAGAALLQAATGEEADEQALGGTEMHATICGLVEYLAEDDAARHRHRPRGCRASRLEQVSGRALPHAVFRRTCLRSRDYRRGWCRSITASPMTCANLRRRIVDGSDFTDFKPRYGVSTVCLQASVYGHACGIIGNNGPIDPQGATKAAQFIQLCDQAGIPLVFLNNTTGYMVGTEYEQAGMIKHGSKMIQAVSNVRVPKHHVLCRSELRSRQLRHVRLCL